MHAHCLLNDALLDFVQQVPHNDGLAEVQVKKYSKVLANKVIGRILIRSQCAPLGEQYIVSLEQSCNCSSLLDAAMLTRVLEANFVRATSVRSVGG